MPRDWLVLPAFAKLNLSLQLLAPRPDRYWEIRTVYQTLALPDRLRLRLRRGSPGSLLVRVPLGGAPAGQANLVYRALQLTRRHLHVRAGIEAELEKLIPLERGLGGGSSDAAAAIIGLLRLTGEQLGPSELERLGAAVGTDVPFFFVGGRALGVGRGDELYPLEDRPAAWCVLGVPPETIRTAEAYRWARRWRLTHSPRAAKITRLPARPSALWAAGNDFEPVVFARFPELARMKAVLLGAGAEQAGLSGSGSSIFALFAQRRAALRAALRLLERMPQTAVLLVRTLPREAYREALGLDEVVEGPVGTGLQATDSNWGVVQR